MTEGKVGEEDAEVMRYAERSRVGGLVSRSVCAPAATAIDVRLARSRESRNLLRPTPALLDMHMRSGGPPLGGGGNSTARDVAEPEDWTPRTARSRISRTGSARDDVSGFVLLLPSVLDATEKKKAEGTEDDRFSLAISDVVVVCPLGVSKRRSSEFLLAATDEVARWEAMRRPPPVEALGALESDSRFAELAEKEAVGFDSPAPSTKRGDSEGGMEEEGAGPLPMPRLVVWDVNATQRLEDAIRRLDGNPSEKFGVGFSDTPNPSSTLPHNRPSPQAYRSPIGSLRRLPSGSPAAGHKLASLPSNSSSTISQSAAPPPNTTATLPPVPPLPSTRYDRDTFPPSSSFLDVEDEEDVPDIARYARTRAKSSSFDENIVSKLALPKQQPSPSNSRPHSLSPENRNSKTGSQDRFPSHDENDATNKQRRPSSSSSTSSSSSSSSSSSDEQDELKPAVQNLEKHRTAPGPVSSLLGSLREGALPSPGPLPTKTSPDPWNDTPRVDDDSSSSHPSRSSSNAPIPPSHRWAAVTRLVGPVAAETLRLRRTLLRLSAITNTNSNASVSKPASATSNRPTSAAGLSVQIRPSSAASSTELDDPSGRATSKKQQFPSGGIPGRASSIHSVPSTSPGARAAALSELASLDMLLASAVHVANSGPLPSSSVSPTPHDHTSPAEPRRPPPTGTSAGAAAVPVLRVRSRSVDKPPQDTRSLHLHHHHHHSGTGPTVHLPLETARSQSVRPLIVTASSQSPSSPSLTPDFPRHPPTLARSATENPAAYLHNNTNTNTNTKPPTETQSPPLPPTSFANLPRAIDDEDDRHVLAAPRPGHRSEEEEEEESQADKWRGDSDDGVRAMEDLESDDLGGSARLHPLVRTIATRPRLFAVQDDQGAELGDFDADDLVPDAILVLVQRNSNEDSRKLALKFFVWSGSDAPQIDTYTAIRRACQAWARELTRRGRPDVASFATGIDPNDAEHIEICVETEGEETEDFEDALEAGF